MYMWYRLDKPGLQRFLAGEVVSVIIFEVDKGVSVAIERVKVVDGIRS